MIAFAFLLSCFFTSSKTATIFAYLIVFGTGLIGSLLLTRLMAQDLWYMTLVELIPSFSLFRCAQSAPAPCTGIRAAQPGAPHISRVRRRLCSGRHAHTTCTQPTLHSLPPLHAPPLPPPPPKGPV